MSQPHAVSDDQFSDTVFQFADEVGPGPIWDLLVCAGNDLPSAARDRAEEAPERQVGWLAFADLLERAIQQTSPADVWKQLRTTLRVYEAYGVDEMSADQRGRIGTESADGGGDLEAPMPMEVQYTACPVCDSEEFLVVMYDSAAILGRCGGCGAESRSRAEIEQSEASAEVDALVDQRVDALQTLSRTRETIAAFEDEGPLENALKLVPLYRLEAQHMRRVRTLTARLAGATSDATTSSRG